MLAAGGKEASSIYPQDIEMMDVERMDGEISKELFLERVSVQIDYYRNFSTNNGIRKRHPQRSISCLNWDYWRDASP